MSKNILVVLEVVDMRQLLLNTGLGYKGPLKVLNGTKLILDDHGNNLDAFRISLESFRSIRGPLLQ